MIRNKISFYPFSLILQQYVERCFGRLKYGREVSWAVVRRIWLHSITSTCAITNLDWSGRFCCNPYSYCNQLLENYYRDEGSSTSSSIAEISLSRSMRRTVSAWKFSWTDFAVLSISPSISRYFPPYQQTSCSCRNMSVYELFAASARSSLIPMYRSSVPYYPDHRVRLNRKGNEFV